jgi:predicted dehydrogenase/threonine dehydrogenase-like Zn-dependent dehydrogenase
VQEVPIPRCADNGVLVRNHFSVISTGTETWTIDSTEPISASTLAKDREKFEKALSLSREVLSKEGLEGLRDYLRSVRNPEFPIGYSSAGTVIEVGRNVVDISVGDRVACAGEGKAVHSEVASVPRNLCCKVPFEGVELREAAFATIGSIAVHAFRRSGAQIGDYIAVIGAGLVGNISAQIAKASGCKVACIDLRDDRLRLAKKLGIDYVIRSDDIQLVPHLANFTMGRGFDAVLICAATESSDPINLAAKIARNKAKITVVGRVGMNLERKDFFQKELDLVMSRSLGPGRYDPTYEEKGVDYPIEYVRWTLNRNMECFIQLLESKKVNVSCLIGGEFPVERAEDAYSFISREDSNVAAVLVYPRTNELELEVGGRSSRESKAVAAAQASATSAESSSRSKSSAIGTAVVGPGNFAKEILIPILRQSKDFSLRWVVSSNPLHATQVARRYRFERSTCNLEDVLDDPETELVVIASPNNLHYKMVIEAAKAGKTVLVEKPLCITPVELNEIKKIREETGANIFVGFNRRYSPQILKIRETMRSLDGPFVLNFRANVGFIPRSRWVQDPEIGGGRIIAECCHFFDLFNFLLGSQGPIEIFVASADVNGSTSVAKDSVAVTLKYHDGSIASLLYVALGSKEMERERLEVFGQGISICLDDFKKLQIFGLPRHFQEELRKQDKGWIGEFKELAKFMRGERSSSAMISFEESCAAMDVTFRVEEALRKNQTKIGTTE